MKIVFYNLAHLGDIYFSQPLIKKFCIFNPNTDISAFLLSSWFLYKDINNLKLLGTSHNEYSPKWNGFSRLESNIYNEEYLQQYNFFHNDFSKNKSFFKQDDTIYINTWFGECHGHVPLCDLYALDNIFGDVICNINKAFNINLNYEKSLHLSITLPQCNIDNFLTFKNDKKVIFYYNFAPMSGQQQQLNHNIHEQIISFLSNTYTNYYICCAIKPNYKNNNIVSVEDFGHIQTPCCKNVSETVMIAMNCDYVFSFDVGACFYYFNDKINDIFKGIWYHVSTDNEFYNKINKYLNNENIRFICINNYNELSNIITKKIAS